MSATFATKSGSLEILQERTRCGPRPCSAQMRCALAVAAQADHLAQMLEHDEMLAPAIRA